MEKTYQYKVSDSTGATFIGLWAEDEILSEYQAVKEINGAGSSVTVNLGRPASDYNEGVDIYFDLRVDIWCYDAEQPNGICKFSGYIDSYIPIEGENEYIQVNLLSYAARMDGYILEEEAPTTPYFTVGNLHNSATYFGGAAWACETFYAEQDAITKIVADIAWDDLLYPAPPATKGTLECAIFNMALGRPSSIVGSWVAETSVGSAIFDFSTVRPATSVGLQYAVLFRATGASVAGYKPSESIGEWNGAAQQLRSNDSGVTWYVYETSGVSNDLSIAIYGDEVDTTVSYSTDVGLMFRDIMDRYNAKGGPLTYDSSTVELTGTTIPYDFNTNSTWEALKKCVELAPPGWYMYVDDGTRQVHFHAKNTTVDHTFLIGKDIVNLHPEKRATDIANIIYFTGAGNPAYFKRYKNLASIAEFGPRVKRYVDTRVSLDSTSEAMSTSVLEQLKSPELRLDFEIVDSNFSQDGQGFDVESLVIGNMMGIRNIEGAAGASLYDVSQYDVAKWDFNIKDLTSVLLQIVRIEDFSQGAKIYCSTIPPDVAKRIQQIGRNLEASQTANNPSAPE